VGGRVEGVAAVRNELTVRYSGSDELVSDEQLAIRVRVGISETPLDWTGVVVEVTDHLVQLSGRVLSSNDRSTVRHAVGSVPGVIRVENDIVIDERSWAVSGISDRLWAQAGAGSASR
jgi:osmotically-inducible protein OsmY